MSADGESGHANSQSEDVPDVSNLVKSLLAIPIASVDMVVSSSGQLVESSVRTGDSGVGRVSSLLDDGDLDERGSSLGVFIEDCRCWRAACLTRFHKFPNDKSNIQRRSFSYLTGCSS